MTAHRPLAELELVPSLTWVDVRSPAEHRRGSIPGAQNVPILSDAERAQVGIEYHRSGPMAAKLLGMQLVGPRLGAMVAGYVRLVERGPLALYCWRGGMRSGLIGGLLQDLGLGVLVLTGGYRAFRHAVIERLATGIPPLIVLHGSTGSGKTVLLRRLAGRFPVVDLEAIGRHRGSTFGAIGLTAQPTQADFEAGLVAAFRSAGPAGPVIVEAESPALGTLELPPPLIARMRAGRRIHVEIPLALRVQVLVEEYAPHIVADPGCLEPSLAYLAGRLGKADLAALTELARAQKLAEFCELLLVKHYDPLYARWRKKATGPTYREIVAGSLEEAEERIAACVREIEAGSEAGSQAGPATSRAEDGASAARPAERSTGDTAAQPGRG